jgi:hypothetical protein
MKKVLLIESKFIGDIMKKLICIIALISLLLIFSTFIAFSESETVNPKDLYYNGFSYIYRGNDIQIMDYLGTESKVIVPSEIEGRKVVKFGYNPEKDKKYYDIEGEYDASSSRWGFRYNSHVEEVYFPDTVIEIEDESFCECKNLRIISLGNGIKKFSTNSFWNCKNLERIILPNSLVKFTGYNLRDTKIANIKFGKNIKTIVGLGYDERLQSVEVSKDNKYFSSTKGVLYNKEKTKIVYYPRCKKNKTYKTPNTITEIGSSALSYNKFLKSITLSKNLKQIGSWAFCDSKKILKILFKGKKTIRIEKSAFSGCEKLNEINIPFGIRTIGKNAFELCENLKKLELPVSLKTIKDSCFYDCCKLKKITIRNGVTKIEKYAFDNCKSLKKISIPKSVKKIGKKAFGYKLKKSGGSYKHIRIKGFTIKGYKGTAAEKYAKKNGFKFVALG